MFLTVSVNRNFDVADPLPVFGVVGGDLDMLLAVAEFGNGIRSVRSLLCTMAVLVGEGANEEAENGE